MYTDKRGVMYSDDKKTLHLMSDRLTGEYKVLDGVTTIRGCERGEGRGSCWSLHCPIILPDSLLKIEDEAFMYSQIERIDFPNGLQSIGSTVFFQSCIKEIYIPASVTHIGKGITAFCNSLVSIVVDPANPVYDSRNNCNAIIETKTNTLIAGCKNTVIPEGVEHIGKNAFEYISLKSVTIPDSVTSIDDYAFSRCGDLVELTMGKGVKSIGSHAFDNCMKLEKVQLPDGLTTIGDNAFYDCDIKSLTIPNNVTDIGDMAFAFCEQLTGIHIPDNVVHIGASAFYTCSKSKSIHIGKGVQTIGEKAFVSYYRHARYVETITVDPANPVYDSRNNCNAIIETKTNTLLAGCDETKIPGDIEHIGPSAFCCCEKIEHIKLHQGIKTIGDTAFSCCLNLASVTIPDGVAVIGKEAFSECQKMQSIIIGEGIMEIGNGTFKNCCNLPSLTIPSGVKSIGEEAFKYCELLLSVSIPEGVTSIAPSAFERCESLISVVLPASVKEVRWCAFEECRKLSSVTFCGQIEKIGYAFSKCTSLAKIIVPKGTKEYYTKLFKDADMLALSKKIREGNPAAVSIQEDGDLIYEDEAKTILHACKPTATEVVVPETVKKISPEAFAECKELISVTIGLGTKSIKSISDKLFRNCPKLSRVVLGESVTKIGKGAFERGGGRMYENGLAQNLQSITLPASLREVGWHGFSGVNTLKEVHISNLAAFCNIDFDEDANPLNLAHHLYLGDEEIHELVIPEGVTRIRKRLFFGCADFTSVTIPDTVTEIGAEAFKGCKGLKTVVIPDSVTKIGKEAFDSTIRLEYHGSAQWEEDNLWWGARSLNGYVENDLVYDSEQKTAILGCLDKSISEVVLPASIKRLGEKAFQDCANLKFITIPDDIEDIEPYAFAGCTNLTSVTLPDSIKCVAPYAFYKCVNLQEIHLPEGVEDIYGWSFCHCERLKQITIPKTVKCLDAWAFHSCVGLETIVFQEPVKLCYWCLYNCTNLQHIIIPKGTKGHFLQQAEKTDLGIKHFATVLEEGSNAAEQQQEVMMLLAMAQGFDRGIGVPRNGEMAISLYRQAAEKGSPEAAYRLGVCYRDGEYVPQDRDAALAYFRQAAESKYKDSDEQVAKLQK